MQNKPNLTNNETASTSLLTRNYKDMQISHPQNKPNFAQVYSNNNNKGARNAKQYDETRKSRKNRKISVFL